MILFQAHFSVLMGFWIFALFGKSRNTKKTAFHQMGLFAFPDVQGETYWFGRLRKN
jgi:hypothetical protein